MTIEKRMTMIKQCITLPNDISLVKGHRVTIGDITWLIEYCELLQSIVNAVECFRQPACPFGDAPCELCDAFSNLDKLIERTK